MGKANFKNIDKTIEILKKFDKVLFLTCSNRYQKILEKQTPKSTILAEVIAENLDNVTLINVPDLQIYPCEGNVSREDGNQCGTKYALLRDKEKNPSGYHRCWASIHNEDDELWKISKELFSTNKNQLTLSPPENLVQRKKYSIGLSENIPLNISNSRLDETLEIKIKSKPNLNLYLSELNNTIANDNKSSLFYSAEQKSRESKNIFNLEKLNNSLNYAFNLKN